MVHHYGKREGRIVVSNEMKLVREKGLVAAALVFCLLVGFSQAFAAQAEDQEELLKKGIAHYLTGRRSFYNTEGSFVEAKEDLLVAKEYFLQLREGEEQYCWLAKIEFVVAELEEASGEKRAAVRAFTESGRWGEQALKCNKRSSDAHRILADSYMRLMDYHGTLYMMSKGPEAMKLLNKAISLDKKNYAACNSLATYYLNAPAIGGGSAAKGIEALRMESIL